MPKNFFYGGLDFGTSGARISIINFDKELVYSNSVAYSYSFKNPNSWINSCENLLASLPIEVKIKDNGSGIPEQFQKNIFEPFVSSKKSSKGGLGLAMVAKIINDHNGIINFETSSEGTIFIINLASAG